MANRDHLFPPTSIGRSQGSRLKTQTSQESLASHPLLSPLLNAPPSQPLAHNGSHLPSISTPKYVPYTPRQRPPPPSPTTSASTQSSVTVPPHSLQGGATEKLQVQNLKAAAQAIGLSSNSVGWAILEMFMGGQDLGEWEHAWNQVTTGKATLLLPSEQLSGHLDTSAEFIRDHVVFCNGPSASPGALVTLSGLRGVVEGEKLAIRSSISPSSALYAGLLKPTTRSTTLLALPPLPHPLNSTQSSPYPTYTLPHYSASLPCPARNQHPPPLPARPSPTRPQPLAAASNTASRLNPFASLFNRSPTPTLPSASPPVTLPTPPPPIPTTDVAAKHDILNLSVFVIDKSIRRKDVARSVARAIKAQVKDTLGPSGYGLPNWMVSRTADFASTLHRKFWDGAEHWEDPSSSGDSGEMEDEKHPSANIPAIKTSGPHHDEIDLSSPLTTSDTFQYFLGSMEADMTTYWGAAGSPKTLSKRNDEKQAASTNSIDKDQRLSDAIDAVERVICSLFYDRLFSPEGSDDKKHDETVAGRVAALNMLDLGLEHLGVEVPKGAKEGVEQVIKAIGNELQNLDSLHCRSPAEKGFLLVSAHNVAVDGLGKLPPVTLKPDGEIEALPDLDKTPIVATFPTVEASDPSVHITPDVFPTSPVSAPAVTDLSPTILEPESGSMPVVNISASPAEITTPLPNMLTEGSHKPPATPTPVSSDVLLPIIIYAVVKANPNQLVSHLLYTQRYRERSNAGGEEGFCLINLLAVAEFLENVDMAALGLAEADRVSVADLSPIPIPAPPEPEAGETNLSARLRGKVDLRVGEIAGSATQVITGVVDSSFSRLRGFLGSDQQSTQQAATGGGPTLSPVIDATSSLPGFGLLRRGSGFSIASMAASIPGTGLKDRRQGSMAAEEGGQPMIEVSSRPGSMREVVSDVEESESDEEEEGSDDEEDEEEETGTGLRSDARSVRSFSSMMSRDSRDDRRERKSLSDRLANVSARFSAANGAAGGSVNKDTAIRKPSPPGSRRASLLLSPSAAVPMLIAEPPTAAVAQVAPPIERFLDISAAELKIGDIPVLLRDYRRLAEALRLHNGFLDQPV